MSRLEIPQPQPSSCRKPLLRQRTITLDATRKAMLRQFLWLKSKNHVATQNSYRDTEPEKGSVTTRNSLSRLKTSSSLFLAFPALCRDHESLIATQTCNSLFFGISCTSNSLPMYLIQYYCLYTYYTCSIKSGKTFQHNIEQVKISFYYKTSHLHIQNWINYLEFYELHNKAKIWPSSQLRP